MFTSIAFASIAILAIGFLIFIHELGHFLVAKKVGIRVEAFSIGFGPKVFGWKRGDTVYKLCLLPLGGYVKMAGELPNEESTGASDEFSSKTVGQRAWVVSAGVIMNILFAFVLFPLAFMIGVPFDTPVVGHVEEGGPAWKADIRPGDEILKVNGSEILDFADIRLELAFAKPDTDASVTIKRDGGTIERLVKPRYNGGTGFNEILVTPTLQPFHFQDSKSAKAAGIRPEDQILSINGIPTWSMIGIGPSDPRFQSLFLDLKSDLRLEVKRADSQKVEMVSIPPDVGEIPEAKEFRIGVEFRNTVVLEKIATIAGLPSAAEAIGLLVDDRIVAVDGKKIALFREFEDAFGPDKKTPRAIALEVERTKDAKTEVVALAAKSTSPIDLLKSIRLGPVGLAFNVTPDGPAARAGLLDGDEIVAIAGKPCDPKKSESRIALSEAVGASNGKPIALRARRNGAESEISITPERRIYNKVLLDLAPYTVAQHRVSTSFAAAIERGIKQVVYQGKNIVAFFRSVFTGRVSGKNVGGIILIAQVSYNYAQQGAGKMLFFMGILSLNLAFLNILPIPVLDGGHLLFLILEKIKGGRVSEKSMTIAFWIGLVLIAALMAFVMFNDVMRALR